MFFCLTIAKPKNSMTIPSNTNMLLIIASPIANVPTTSPPDVTQVLSFSVTIRSIPVDIITSPAISKAKIDANPAKSEPGLFSPCIERAKE